jgi:phosphoglycolate phosphatase-like HAD superfamily hydrolase
VSGRPLLLLWDIDGTLLQRASAEHGRALREAAARVHGLESLDGVTAEYAGRTDAAILRDLLRLAGVEDSAIDAHAEEVRNASAELFASLCPDDLSRFVAPGVPAVLAAAAARGFRQALLTGNFEPIGRLKVARAGLGSYFQNGQGAFGSDSVSRARLPAIARGRAGEWPRERTVVIGDTPRDIACARADEVRVIAVATGPFGVEELADADAVVDDARALLPVLSDWATGRPVR